MRISDWSSDVCSSDLHWRSVLALTPQDNQVFLREVDDALRQDRLASFGMRYGIWLLALIVLTLLAFGAWLCWTHQPAQKAGEPSDQLSKTLTTLPARSKAAAATPANAPAAAKQPGYRADALLIRGAR